MKPFSSILTAVLIATLSTQCNSPMKLDRQIAASNKLNAPQAAPLQMSRRMEDFGRMLTAYLGSNSGTLVEVDLIPNNSGVFKELPKDLGFNVVQALTSMDYGLRVQRSFESNIMLESTNSSPIQRNRPIADFVIKGELQCNSERVLGQSELRAGVLGKAEGHQIDGQAALEKRAVVKNLRVGLYLEDRTGASIPGVPATSFEVWYRSDTNTASVSLFADGTGLGGSREYQVNQDVGGAVFDASAACVMKLMGYLFKVPYHRIAPDIFGDDDRVERLKGKELAGSTRTSLLGELKGMLQNKGVDFNSGNDEATILAAVRKSGLGTSDDDLIKFYLSQWRSFDYRNAAGHVEREFAKSSKNILRQQEEAHAKAAAQAPPPGPGPETFGWPASTSILVIDVKRVPDIATVERLINAASTVPGCRAVRHLDTQGLVGLNFSGSPADLQRAFRALAIPYNFIWVNRQWNAMVVVPLPARKA